MKPKVIVHVDMDAFFASVEQRDNPRLKGKPVVIGADPKLGKGRGVAATCSYEARKYGIHSAQPISQAYRLCPQAVFLRGDLRKYARVSKQIRKIFYDFTPDVEPISIDEAFLDITGSYHFYKTPKGLCQRLKQSIIDELGLTASVGIAPVKMVAKIASDINKPDGLLEIKEGQVLRFLNPLSVGKLWGVGKKTQEVLHRLGIQTVGQLAQVSQQQLSKIFGRYGIHLYELSHGIDPREVKADDSVKSVSHEHTFEEDEGNIKIIEQRLLMLCEKVSRRLRKYGLKGRAVTMKIRLKGFETYTRSVTLDRTVDLNRDVYKAARKLLLEFFRQGQKVRLVGVKVAQFEDFYVQDDLFADMDEKKARAVEAALDQIKDKFGEKVIHWGGG